MSGAPISTRNNSNDVRGRDEIQHQHNNKEQERQQRLLIRLQVLDILFPKTDAVLNTELNDVEKNAKAVFSETTTCNSDSCDSHQETKTQGMCVVCLESISNANPDNTEKSSILHGLTCEHTFHYVCLLDWMKQQHDECSICRHPLWDADLYSSIEKELLISKGVLILTVGGSNNSARRNNTATTNSMSNARILSRQRIQRQLDLRSARAAGVSTPPTPRVITSDIADQRCLIGVVISILTFSFVTVIAVNS